MEGHVEAWHHGYSNNHQQSEQHQRSRTFIRGGKRGRGDGDIRGRGRGGSRGRSRGRGRGNSRGRGKIRGEGYGRGRGAFREAPWEAQMFHMLPPPTLKPDNDPCEEDDEEDDDEYMEDGDEFTVRAKTRIIPLGPFNEGVPTSFPAAMPPGFHRGFLCQQPVSVPARRVADDDALDIAVVMGQEVEDMASEKDSTVSSSSGGNKKSKMKKKDRDILDHALRSRVNLPAMQFVNRDKREIDALARGRNVQLPRKTSRNDLSDDEVADLRDFEVPFTDLEADTVPLERRLSGTLKEGVVLNRKGELICDDARVPPSSFLQCHMCDKRGFTHLSLYKEHLAGDMHERLRAMHVATLQAGLAYLRAAAKKAETRLSMGLLRSSADPSAKLNNFCDVCGCNVLESRLHAQLPQHRLVEKFLFPVCCGEKFRNRVEFEDHRTSPAHLRELFKERLALAHRLQQGRLKGEERYQSLPEYLRLLKTNCLVVDDDNNTANLTPYDPSRPNVVKLLKYHGRVQCLCCGNTFGPQELEQLYEHVHSLEHYEAAVLYTTQREREAVHSSIEGDEEQVRRVARRCRKVLGVAAALVDNARAKASSSADARRVLPPPPPAGGQRGIELVGGEPVPRSNAQMTGVTLSEDDVAMATV